ncbi:Ty1/Copia-like polyprotein/retrotransposon, putative [Medicago truncatula]|uniref:Ty1/Copia-like polyprotein/retrotransposon, putative n=1 Tax=Medicago truncatula TaxID=3880 RepID=G7JFL9_MEDTR|nr:Ty1/Copia-like polyprotein/retrotransposon, putative [Medicago truncatula]
MAFFMMKQNSGTKREPTKYEHGKVFFSHKTQNKYVEEINERVDMSSCKPYFEPTNTNVKLNGSPYNPYHDPTQYFHEPCWLKNLLYFGASLSYHKSCFIYWDNVNVIYLSNNPVQHRHITYIEICNHFVRGKVVRVLYVPSRCQIIDILTKGLKLQLFNDF